MTHPDTVTQSAASRILGRSRGYASTLLKRGHIQPVNVAGEQWVSLSEIRAWIESPKKRNRK